MHFVCSAEFHTYARWAYARAHVCACQCVYVRVCTLSTQLLILRHSNGTCAAHVLAIVPLKPVEGIHTYMHIHVRLLKRSKQNNVDSLTTLRCCNPAARTPPCPLCQPTNGSACI